MRKYRVRLTKEARIQLNRHLQYIRNVLKNTQAAKAVRALYERVEVEEAMFRILSNLSHLPVLSGFRTRKSSDPVSYDRERQKPVILSSICTGEKTAGFQDRESKKFIPYGLIRDEKDLQDFKEACGVRDLETIY